MKAGLQMNHFFSCVTCLALLEYLWPFKWGSSLHSNTKNHKTVEMPLLTHSAFLVNELCAVPVVCFLAINNRTLSTKIWCSNIYDFSVYFRFCDWSPFLCGV